MQKLVPITKKQAIEKFGHRFIISRDKNKYKYIVEECLGSSGSWYKNDDFYTTKEAAFEAMCNKIKDEAKEYIKYHEELMKFRKNKFTMFKYKYGILNKDTQSVIAELVKRYEMAKENIKEQPKIKYLLKLLPDMMYIPELCFEKDKEYYYFVDAETMHHNSKLQIVKAKDLEVDFCEKKSLILIKAYFENIDRSHLSSEDILEMKDGYINVGYKNCYLFFDKDKCRAFASDRIKNEIKSLENILEEFG